MSRLRSDDSVSDAVDFGVRMISSDKKFPGLLFFINILDPTMLTDGLTFSKFKVWN